MQEIHPARQIRVDIPAQGKNVFHVVLAQPGKCFLHLHTRGVYTCQMRQSLHMKPVFDIRRNLCSRLSGRASARAISNADKIRIQTAQTVKRFIDDFFISRWFRRKNLK